MPRDWGWLATAAVLGLIRLAAPYLPVGDNGGGLMYDLGQAHAICALFGQTEAGITDCGKVALAYDGLNAVAVAAVVCVVLFLAGMTMRRSNNPEP
jgi:hypothetical protein